MINRYINKIKEKGSIALFFLVSGLTLLSFSCRTSPIKEIPQKQSRNEITSELQKYPLVDSIYDTLTLDEKLDQMLIIPYDYALKNKHENFGGIIYLGWDTKELSKYGIDSLISLNEMFDSRLIKPLIMIDEEGGNISRLKYFKEFRELCKNEKSIICFMNKYKIGKDGKQFLLPWEYEIGQAYEKALRKGKGNEFLKDFESFCQGEANILIKIKFNTVLGPVVDIPPTPKYIMWKRSYSSNVKVVKILSQIYTYVFNKNGIKTCLKHFPGLGKTKQNLHYKTSSIPNWTEQELLPFFNKNSQLIMISHGEYPKIDSFPATISLKVKNIIPNKKDIVISDDISMQGFMKNFIKFDRVEILRRALLVNDFIIIASPKGRNSYDIQTDTMINSEKKDIIKMIRTTVQNNPDLIEIVNKKCYKILKFKARNNMIMK